jgi:hypothetical protein
MAGNGGKGGHETKAWEIWIAAMLALAAVCIAIAMTNGSMTVSDLVDPSNYGFAPGTPPGAMIGVGVVMLIIIGARLALRSKKRK